MQVTYTNKYVAFLDILGYKSMVLESEINEEILKKICMTMDYINRTQVENINGVVELKSMGKEVGISSDSIVISYDIMYPGAGFFMLLDLVHICNNMLALGVFLRGGVTVGTFYHEDNKFWGPAHIKAYEMESNKAVYPRIVIDEKVKITDLEHKPDFNSIEYEENSLAMLIKEDKEDKLLYLDYLAQVNEFDSAKRYIEHLKQVKKLIEKQIGNNNYNKNIQSKYMWFKEYYNEVIERVIVDNKKDEFKIIL